MLIELGPRMIGRCQLGLKGCTAKNFNIVKKVLMAKDGKSAWVCQKCLLKKVKMDHEEYKKRRKQEVNPSL